MSNKKFPINGLGQHVANIEKYVFIVKAGNELLKLQEWESYKEIGETGSVEVNIVRGCNRAVWSEENIGSWTVSSKTFPAS